MVIKIVAVGNLKEKYWIDAKNEYQKRLSKYCQLEIVEIKEEKASVENESNIDIVKKAEGRKILDKLGNSDYVYLLDLRGKEYTSIELAGRLDNIKQRASTLTFIIGGSYGVSDEVKNKANELIAFSKLTFPHQLFRVMLLEQIYRCFKINNNEKYHK